MGRRGRVLIVAATLAAAGLAVALLVVRAGGGNRDLPLIGGEGSGTVTVAPALVEPRDPAAPHSPPTPEPNIVPGDADQGPEGEEAPGNLPAENLGVSVGSANGLYPGHRVKLGVTYMNPYSFPIAIDEVHITTTGAARCSARNLVPTPQPTPGLRIPSGSSVASTLEVGMRKTAPDACQGVRFAVRVHVTAVQL